MLLAGVGGAAGEVPSPTRRPRQPQGVDPVRFRRRHLWFRRGVPKNGVGFSFGFPVTAKVRDAVAVLAAADKQADRDGLTVWYPAIDADGEVRDGAWIAEATALVDLSAWPEGPG